MSLVHEIASSFNIAKKREDEIHSGIQTFWTSNDQFSLAEILPDIKEEKNSDNLVNLLVAESDVFSILDKVEGDIIICDIDQNLLDFMEIQTKHLLSLYNDYTEKRKDFKKVTELYEECLRMWSNNCDASAWMTDRRDQLGKMHFLYDEETYKKSMSALKRKNIVTININLFDKAEQKALCDALNENHAQVKLFNLTNLPDYDQKDAMSELLADIPWAKNPKIIWNIHDRGPFEINPEDDLYAHYLFMASTPDEYKQHVQKRPEFFARLDQIALAAKGLEEADPLKLRRYSNISQCHQELPNEEKRAAYLNCIANPFVYEKEENEARLDVCKVFDVERCPRDRSSMDFIERFESEVRKIRETVNEIEWGSGMSELARAPIEKVIDSIVLKVRTVDLRSSESRTKMESELNKDKNRVSFLICFARAINKINNVIGITYYGDENNYLRQEVKQFLSICMDKACNKSEQFVSKEGQQYFKNTLIKDAQDFKFTHRLFDAEKHYVIRAILNAFMLIPIFGLIKFAMTGSYFFGTETRRKSFIKENVNNLFLPSPVVTNKI